MKTQVQNQMMHHPKAKTGGRTGLSTQQAVFELKQRVVLSLNKLADRDTHQIAADELEKIAHRLTPEGISPFLSCITDTDSDQKSAVRKECVRVMGTLARFHSALLPPHLPKMLASIVKRLKDSDTVVRDACVDTIGVLAASLSSSSSSSDGSGSAFVAIARPLFEALGEQNKYVQAGSALCLARAIDEATDPPASLLPQMLARVVKLLKNPHFMAKPAIIELIRSIVQAGGASTEHTLSATIASILDALKSTDWTTRKAASVALAGIAVRTRPVLGSFKASCIRSLERCRFDKVKPVRDAIMEALQCWKALPGPDSPEPSEAGSSTKENMNGDCTDVTTASDGGWRDTSLRRVGPASAVSGNSSNSSKKRTPLTVRKTCPNYVQNRQYPNPNDWHIEISLPKSRNVPSVDHLFNKSGRCCTKEAFEGNMNADRAHDIKYVYDPADDKPECSSMSDLVSGSFETKHITLTHERLDEDSSANLIRMSDRSAADEVDTEGHSVQERNSMDSTITDLCSRDMHGCCLHAANELGFIRKQLVEIETKQSSLLDLLQVFMGNSVDNLSTLQLKVQNLEHAVDKIMRNTSRAGNYSSMASSKLMKKNQNVTSSPRLSTSTPRPSVDSNYRNHSLFPLTNKELWGESAYSKSRSSTSVKEGLEQWKDPTLNIIKNPILQGSQKNSRRRVQISGSSETKETRDSLSLSASNTGAKQRNLEGTISSWQQVKEFMNAGDMESAYAEALCCSDDLCLIELMDRTGPLLEKLSHEIADAIISTLTTHFLNQRFTSSLIPWFRQVVDLSTAHGPRHLILSNKTRVEFLFALREAAAMEEIDPVDRISIAEFASKLSQVWVEAPSRKVFPSGGSRGSKNSVSIARD